MSSSERQDNRPWPTFHTNGKLRDPQGQIDSYSMTRIQSLRSSTLYYLVELPFQASLKLTLGAIKNDGLKDGTALRLLSVRHFRLHARTGSVKRGILEG
jgi:hypothetical protein